MDDLALDRREVLRVADHAVVEARADGQQHVAVLHRHVGLEGAVHAEHAEERGSLAGIAPSPISVFVQGKPSRSASWRSSVRRVAQHDAAAGVDVGPLGLQQQLHGLADLPAGPSSPGCTSASPPSPG